MKNLFNHRKQEHNIFDIPSFIDHRHNKINNRLVGMIGYLIKYGRQEVGLLVELWVVVLIIIIQVMVPHLNNIVGLHLTPVLKQFRNLSFFYSFGDLK